VKFDSYLWIPSKAGYVRGQDKPNVDCILCSIRDRDPRVRSLEVWRDEGNVAVLNLYPYNPGHIMVFPARHMEELSDLEEAEALGLMGAIRLAVDVLKERYTPKGFNIGFNLGPVSGASIAHLHAHVVPRYRSELGFIDIIGGAKVMVEDPAAMVDEVRKSYEKLSVERK
jgi:ATP adenylyltransferase